MIALIVTFLVGLFSEPRDLYDICMALRSQCKKIVQDNLDSKFTRSTDDLDDEEENYTVIGKRTKEDDDITNTNNPEPTSSSIGKIEEDEQSDDEDD